MCVDSLINTIIQLFSINLICFHFADFLLNKMLSISLNHSLSPLSIEICPETSNSSESSELFGDPLFELEWGSSIDSCLEEC